LEEKVNEEEKNIGKNKKSKKVKKSKPQSKISFSTDWTLESAKNQIQAKEGGTKLDNLRALPNAKGSEETEGRGNATKKYEPSDLSDDRVIVGFIAATPIRYKINADIVETFTIDFLCVHQDLRGKRLAPILMKELSIRLQKLGMSTGSIFSTRTVLNFCPITSPTYYYRPIDIEKLVSTGHVKSVESANELRQRFKVDFTPAIKCFHTLAEKDIPEALELMHQEINKRQLGLVLTEEEFYHYFLRFDNIVKTFIIRDPITGELTELISFYTHESATGGKQAHLYYLASNVLPSKIILMNAMYIASQFNYDYFFILDVFGLMSDPGIAESFIDTGVMKHYYLWNYNIDALHPFYCGMLLT